MLASNCSALAVIIIIIMFKWLTQLPFE